MGRFDHLATQPRRGPADILRWKVVDAIAGKNRKDPGGFTTPARPHDRALVAGAAPSLTWIGHASFLVTLGGARLLIDPVYRDGPGPLRRLAPPGIPLGELPPIDAVLITHNHRDHLDTWTLSRLGGAPLYIAPVGHEAVLRKAGAQRIVELDWWGVTTVGGVEITLVPARHWSMRFPWDRNDALWGGYLMRADEGTAYHSGDTAFFDGFAEIGRRAGAIDWAMLPIGAYDPRWFMQPQHMCPEEAIEASLLLGARRLVAMHWGTYRLTDEPPGEPPERARAGWQGRGLPDDALWILDVGETRALTR
ncbi:MBL fold metallo-hydrolase [Sorangium sp. So ce1335]|uniref:MBL fold metallo-hydrolase n=1 Tax=Sorangium sp. So ce1335 TaxID=3133335 RepID=UPI003F644D01